MVLQGGRRGAREGGKGVGAAADGAARKVHVQVLQGKHTGRVVRAWPRHVWPTAPADPVAAPLEYDADEVGSLHHEPSPPPSPCARVGWPSYGHRQWARSLHSARISEKTEPLTPRPCATPYKRRKPRFDPQRPFISGPLYLERDYMTRVR